MIVLLSLCVLMIALLIWMARISRVRPFVLLITMSVCIVLFDQATKMAVKGIDLFGLQVHGMQMYESRPVVGDAVRVTYVENPGMAFGLNFGMPVILSLFSIVAACFLIYLIRRTEKDGITGLRIALALILGGAVGNLIDRTFYGVLYHYAPLFYGKVVDFIDVDLPDIKLFGGELKRFYVFNIADAAVSVGVILLLFFYPSKRPAHHSEPVIEPVSHDSDGAPPLAHHEMTVG